MNDHRSPEEIERELEEDRAGLADSLEDLRDKFSIDTLVRQTAGQIREHSGDIGASVSRAVKENPIAVALTGIGLAWLIFGERKPAQAGWHSDQVAARPASQSSYDRRSTGTRYGEKSVQATDAPAWTRDVDEVHDNADTDDNDSSGSAKASLNETAENMRDRATALRERLSEGTEQLSEEGRARVIAAREKAHAAREAAMDRMTDARDKAVDLFEEQPLIAGALALALGAAIGAALPHTRFEDENFGETSDELVREAERILAEERAKLSSAVGDAVDEVGQIAQKAAANVGQAASSAGDSDGGASSDTGAQDQSVSDGALPEDTKSPIRDIPS